MERILVLQHVENEPPGRLQTAADKLGAVLEVVELWKSDYHIPNVGDYQGLIVMGGPMGVYENYPSGEDELVVIKKADELKIPTMGFCLGSQLLAHYLGADVHKNMVGGKHIKEIGYDEVSLTIDGLNDQLLKVLPARLRVLQWHGDAFELPKGATLLATSGNCRNQAFQRRNMWGFLFHFEFTPEMVDNQIEVDREWIHTDFIMDEERLKREARELNDLMGRQCEILFGNFLKVIHSRR